MQQPSRIELARRRLATARLVVGAGSVVAFAALALVARAAHPGAHKAAAATAATTATSSQDTQNQDGQDDSFFGSPSIASSSPNDTGSAQTSSGGS
jgi:hypothetical protein